MATIGIGVGIPGRNTGASRPGAPETSTKQVHDFIQGQKNQSNNDTYNRDTQREDQLRKEDRENYLADREHTEQREDTAYQRMYNDLKAIGINPEAIFLGISPQTSGSTTSTQQPNSYRSSLESIDIARQGNLIKIIGILFQFIGSTMG